MIESLLWVHIDREDVRGLLQSYFLSILRDGSVYALLMRFIQAYGPQFCVLFILVCITIWRKELSSNHVYHSNTRLGGISRSSRCYRRNNRKAEGRMESSDTTQSIRFHGISDVLDAVVYNFSFLPILAVICNSVYLDYGGYGSNRLIVYDFTKYIICAVNSYFFAACLSRSLMQESNNSSECFDEVSSREERSSLIKKIRESYHATNSTMSLITNLPSGVQVHLFSFLSARDVCEFSCVSMHCANLTDDHHYPSGQMDYGDSTAALIWNNMLLRDFGAVLHWDVAQMAFRRSLSKMGLAFDGTINEFLISSHFPDHRSRKDFYFYFSESWINWSLAGENSEERCLVGLHGSILNMSQFLDSHPGTPETILMQGGRDVTKYFEDIGHSIPARKVALDCVLIDRNDLYHEIDFFVDEFFNPIPLPMQRSTPWKIGNIKRVRDWMQKEFNIE